jgi:hypothetical protein
MPSLQLQYLSICRSTNFYLESIARKHTNVKVGWLCRDATFRSHTTTNYQSVSSHYFH